MAITKKTILVWVLSILVLTAVASYAWFQVRKPVSNQNPAAPNKEQGQSIEGGNDIKDTGGEDADTNQSALISESGELTVYLPQSNQLFTSGSTISGEAAAAIVYYRIIDYGRGLIAQGSLKVVKGEFSARIEELSTYSQEGHVEVYTLNPNTNKEANNLEVKVRFQ